MVNGYNDGKNFAILDLETTGLVPSADKIIEVAWTTTKGDLAMPMSVFSRVISNPFTREALRRALPVVQEMHKATGLWDEVMDRRSSTRDEKHQITTNLSWVEDEIIGHLDARSDEGDTWHLLGASVHFDKSFIEQYMPRLTKRIHHRILDTSSLKLLAGAAGITIPEPTNPLAHRAANDVREALAYAQAFRDLLKSMSGGSDIVDRAHDPKRMRGII